MTARTALVCLLLASLTGCGSGRGEALPGDGPASRTVDTAPARDALDLVGRWHVEGDGVAPGTALVLGESAAAFLPCGVLDADWDADAEQGLFLAASSSGDGSCFPPGGRVAVPWLEGARAFDVDGEDVVLHGAGGQELARLRPGARPTPGPNRTSDHAEEPELTARLRERLARPVPLDGDAEPATPEALQRRWRPVGVANEEAHLRFAADGSYTGSDGCNGQGGRYVLGSAGRFLATSGPQTLIGCDGAPVGAWASAAAHAGLVDGDLVLHAPDGSLLGRLSPA